MRLPARRDHQTLMSSGSDKVVIPSGYSFWPIRSGRNRAVAAPHDVLANFLVSIRSMIVPS
jgi:hypothetical protein